MLTQSIQVLSMEAMNNECMLDRDGDGYGDISATGFYDIGTDCNDSDPQSTYSNIDLDCDGVETSIDCDDSDPYTVNDMDVMEILMQYSILQLNL